MQRNHVSRVDFLECLDRISNVFVLIGREMKAPDHRMNFFHTGGGLSLPDRVDYAAMAARSEDDKPASFQIECRRDLVLKLIRYDGRTAFRVAEALGIAADTSVETNGHCARCQRPLEAVLGDLPRGPGVIGNQGRSLRDGYGEVGLLECSAVDDAEVAPHRGCSPLALAEASFAADKQRQFGL